MVFLTPPCPAYLRLPSATESIPELIRHWPFDFRTQRPTLPTPRSRALTPLKPAPAMHRLLIKTSPRASVGDVVCGCSPLFQQAQLARETRSNLPSVAPPWRVRKEICLDDLRSWDTGGGRGLRGIRRKKEEEKKNSKASRIGVSCPSRSFEHEQDTCRVDYPGISA